MSSLQLPFNSLVVIQLLVLVKHEILLGAVVQHLDRIALENVLQFIVLEQIVRFFSFSSLLTLNSKTIDCINFNTLVDVQSLLVDVLTNILRLIIRL